MHWQHLGHDFQLKQLVLLFFSAERLRFAILLYAPLILNEKIGCISSLFKNTSLPNLVEIFAAKDIGVFVATSYTFELAIKSKYFLEDLKEPVFFILSLILVT